MEAGLAAFLRASWGGPLPGELRRTPRRASRAWKYDLLSGYREEPARILTPLRGSAGRDVVAVRGLDFVSTCAHHLLPFHGKVHVAYLSDGRIAGVSRIARLVACLSRRLQIQEDLTREIVSAVQDRLAPRGAACVVEASHLCMTARGGRAGGTVVTSAFTGCYETSARARAQILALLGIGAHGRRLR
jgi:GTP cyclohydrolase I